MEMEKKLTKSCCGPLGLCLLDHRLKTQRDVPRALKRSASLLATFSLRRFDSRSIRQHKTKDRKLKGLKKEMKRSNSLRHRLRKSRALRER